ncbi:MAG: FAD:protein FMN transferase [Ktedonobacteraceae bacterium]|nr:FAD:protein FMN transferase [Ktedonobacteraceae bacterium]
MDKTITHNHSQAPTPPEQAWSLPFGMSRTQFRAMGTAISLLLPDEQSEQGTQIVQDLFSLWEQTLSRFLPESELSRLNALSGKPVVVSDLLYTVLETALTAAQTTQGVYDPTLLRQMVQVGYDHTFDELSSVQPATSVTISPGGGWRQIQLDADQRRVTLPLGIGLDFGGIAKGMAVDAALNSLREAGIETALVNAGGDLAVLGFPSEEEQWPIAVPGKEQSWNIPLRQGAMATSGIARRRWQQGGQQRHHLVDPRTGTSAQSGLWSVTVAAARCEQAEVGAKVAFILGKKRGANFLRSHSLAGLLVCEDGTWEAVAPWPVHFMEEQR